MKVLSSHGSSSWLPFPFGFPFGVVGHHPLWWHFSTLEKKCGGQVLQLVDFYLSNKNKVWLFSVYIGNYTTQLCGDSNKPLEESLLNNQYIMENNKFLCVFFFFVAHLMHGKHPSIRLKLSRIAWAKQIGPSSVPKRYGASSRKTGAMGWRAEKSLKRTVFSSNFKLWLKHCFNLLFRIGIVYKALHAAW